MRCKRFGLFIGVVASLMFLSAMAGQGGTASAETAGNSWTTYLYLNEIVDLEVTTDGVWCASTGGALYYEFAESKFTSWHRANEGLASDTLNSVIVLEDDRIAFGTDKVGVSVYNPDNQLWYNYNSAVWPLAGNSIRYLREDEQWRIIGTEMGFTAFENGEQRKICQQGLDICDLSGWVIRCGMYHDGFIWLGTWTDNNTGAGVSRYNYENTGQELGIWETLNDGLSELTVREFAVWNDTFYCITEVDVYSWTGTTWQIKSDGLPSDITLHDLQAGAGRLLLAGSGDVNGGVFEFDAGVEQWTRVGENQLNARCVAEGDDGIIWAGTSAKQTVSYEENDGLWEFVGGQWIQHRAESPYPRAFYRTLAIAPDGDLWGATSGNGWRLVHFNDPDWSFYDEENTNLTNNWVFDLQFDDDRLFVGHCCCPVADVCNIDHWPLDDTGINTTLGVFNIYDSTPDDWGNFWFASYHEGYGNHPERANGLHHYHKATDTWSNYTIENTDGRIRSDAISAIASEGRYLWIGYLDQGLTRVRLQSDGTLPPTSTGWTQFIPGSVGNPLVGDRITAIAARPDEIWVGTDSGVSIYNREGTVGSWTSFRASEDQLPANGVVDITLSASDAWLGFSGSGVTQVHREADGEYRFTTYTTPDLVNANVTALAADTEGETVWIGTQAGLSRFVSRTEVPVVEVDDLNVYPNPYNATCGDPLRFQNLPGVSSGGVIVDTAGRVVAQIANGLVKDDAFWDGLDESGEPVASGLYLVRVSTPKGWLTGRVALIDLLPCDD
jgi:hypothetical protein